MGKTKQRVVGSMTVLILVAIVVACFAFSAFQRQQNTLRLGDAVRRRRGSEAEVRSLLASGADPNAPASPPLLTLAEMLRSMFRRRQPQGQQETIFIYASGHQNERILRILLESGGDMRQQTYYGATALLMALGAQSHPNVELLVQHGADVNCYGARMIPLAAALHRTPGTEDLVFLLAHGADPNGYDQYGISPLMWAAFYGDPTCIRVLLQAGADINRRDTVGATALMHAVLNGKKQPIEVLLEAGADPTLRDQRGRTAEDLAIAMRNKPLEQFLHNYHSHGPGHK
jgi:ankyrin repeat protein